METRHEKINRREFLERPVAFAGLPLIVRAGSGVGNGFRFAPLAPSGLSAEMERVSASESSAA